MVSYLDSPLLSTIRGKFAEPPAEVRADCCQQLILGLDQYYVHLPQKRAAFAIDPIQALTLLRRSDGRGYTRQLLRIMTSLRDRHTTLRLAPPWSGMVAYVPFALERMVDGKSGRDITRYIVTRQLFGFTDLPVGVTVTHWNGAPIEYYVSALADETQGASWPARMRLAVANLTVRPMAYMLMPIEDWVAITYHGQDGVVRTIAVPWRFYVVQQQQPAPNRVNLGAGQAPTLDGLDPSTLMTNLFVRDSQTDVREQRYALVTDDPLRYGVVHTTSGDAAYLRIFSFEVPDVAAFVAKVARLLPTLPSERLIVDVRGNPGGMIPAGQKLLRLLTNKPLSASPVAFRNTQSTLDLARIPEFSLWQRSIEMQHITGQNFSQSFPLSNYDDVPAYRYPGKVALIIDSLCYSTTDFLAADFADNNVGVIVGIDPTTGGGGANVWNWDVLTYYATAVGGRARPLPWGYSLNISMRRSMRTGANANIPVEDIGVAADVVHHTTLADLLNDNVDLLNFTAATMERRA